MTTPRQVVFFSLILLSAAAAFAIDPAPAKKRKPRPTSTPVNPFAAANSGYLRDPYATTAKPNVMGNPYYPTKRSATRNPYLTMPPASQTPSPSSTPPAGGAPLSPTPEPQQ